MKMDQPQFGVSAKKKGLLNYDCPLVLSFHEPTRVIISSGFKFKEPTGVFSFNEPNRNQTLKKIDQLSYDYPLTQIFTHYVFDHKLSPGRNSGVFSPVVQIVTPL